MTAVDPSPSASQAHRTLAESERREFALGHTHTLSRDALIAAFRRAAEAGPRDFPNDLPMALAASWGTLLGALGIDEAAGVRPW